jgi:serine/threonine-protein kinase
VLPTADLLMRRVGELATTLHELDRDAPPSLLVDVEARVAEARRSAGDPPEPDQARRIELLGRQVETLTDLAQRRAQLTARLESASLMLQNMRLDLLRLRSAGIDAALGELTSVTREASALSRDIGRALDVAAELRRD